VLNCNRLAARDATWKNTAMLAEERDLLIPTSPINSATSFPWTMAAIAILVLAAAMFLFRYLTRRAADQH
jgi:hypothetical protein